MNTYGLKANLVVGSCVALLATTVSADAPEDPWASLPATPASCYSGEDGFADSIGASIGRLDEEIAAQQAVNTAIKDQAFSSGDDGETDMMAMAARMQQYMMDDPEKAMQMMQNLTSESNSEETQASLEREMELAPVLDENLDAYDAAYEGMYASSNAKFAGLPTIEGEAGSSFAPEALGDLRRISREANAEYEALCAKWFHSGPMLAWLEEYRGFLTEDRVPRQEHLDDLTRQQFEFQRVDVTNYRSTAAMAAARDYAKALGRIFAKRQEQPFDFAYQYLGSH